MRPPFPSAAQAYAESIDSATASRHHPNARLTILPLPSLAALYPMEHDNTLTSSHDRRSSSSSSSSPTSSNSDPSYRRQAHPHQQPSYQSYDARYQKNPSSSSSSSSSTIPAAHNTASTSDTQSQSQSQLKPAGHEYLGTNMESLLNAIEVHPTLYAHSESSRRSSTPFSTSSPTLSSAPTSPYNPSPMTFGSASPSPTAAMVEYSTTNSHKCPRASTPSRMSISHLVDDIPYDSRDDAVCEPILEDNRPRLKPMVPRASSPLFESAHKRKWSSDSIDDNRNNKIRLSIQDHVAAKALESFNMASVATGLSAVTRPSQPSTFTTRPQMTTITCYHASVAQKSYGAEKRFLCPPPTVHIDAPFDESFFGLSNRPQVAMSVICEAGENSLGQRSILEDDRSCAFRFLYVSGTAKAKSFQLKLEIYGRACLPNGFLSPEDPTADAEAPEPFAVFESAPVAIISKPSKKTAKARNVSSCILAGSLVSLFNRINSQTVRTKYMSVDGDSLCAKSATWSAFTISIVSNGPSSPAPARGSQKSHHRQQSQPTATPITYGAEIILTESATGIQSDRLVVCKVENGRILEGAVGPICQMQKVALKSLERSTESEPVYLGALGEEHQGGRFLDHGVSTTTTLKYQPSQMVEGAKPGSDDFLCWTIVGISKFEYSYFESLPTSSSPRSGALCHAITPFPTLLKEPVYNAVSQALELSVSNFYSQLDGKPMPMQIWLGSVGPLTTHIIRSHLSSPAQDQTTVLVDLPVGQASHIGINKATPLLFVRPLDGITYDSRAKVTFHGLEETDRWTVQML
ncbi:MAG: hypothetical protein BYD32DRAFT_64190 [Podila humilis]|nr:MAG: hypothetical protein BYD32DRAFT_64190 [Podila humilis]